MAVQIKKAELTAQINEGWKIDKLATHYELPVLTMRRVLKEAGLVIRSFKKPKFELIDDTLIEAPVILNQLDLFETVQQAEDTSTIVEDVQLEEIFSEPVVTNEVPEEIEIAEIEAIESELNTPTLGISDAYIVDESIEDTSVLESGLAEDDLLAEMEAILSSGNDSEEVSSTEPSVMEEEDDFWDQPL